MKENHIFIPQDWTQPKYQLGQLVEQGWIVGMRYYPGYSAMGRTYQSGWHYDIVHDWLGTDTTYHMEEEVQPYSPEETLAKLQAEIDTLTARIGVLRSAMDNVFIKNSEAMLGVLKTELRTF